jgi:xanthine dehydrogenase accessory factor
MRAVAFAQEVSGVQEVAEAVRKGNGEGRQAVFGRIIGMEGFSTVPGDPVVAIDAAGTQHGDVLGQPGRDRLQTAAQAMFASGNGRLETVPVEIRGKQVSEVGLACGGKADVLLQPIATIPPQLWDLLAERAPVALLTCIEGPSAGPEAVVVDRFGQAWGPTALAGLDGLVDQAMSGLTSGRSTSWRTEVGDDVVLVEAWVPEPRLVVVGGGDLAGALTAQGALLGWDCRWTEDVGEFEALFEWAGATAALIVLSHDPHLDTPALTMGLARGVPYVGALGSRATQSRRTERLLAGGVEPAALDRIHRPIGLDLGGRRSPEVALAIVAQILASHCGRDGRPLAQRDAPINDRPGLRRS